MQPRYRTDRSIDFKRCKGSCPIYRFASLYVTWIVGSQFRIWSDMECSVLEGKTHDTVHFTRSGVNGQLTVAADHFDLKAKLGFLLGAFSKTIETEILKNLDALLERGARSAVKPAANKAASKTAAKK